MSEDRLKRAFELYRAMRHLPENEREAALRERCPDDEVMRREVLDLLRTGASDAATATIRQPPTPGSPATPTNIGPYKILETLGEGGMGIVYLAEQTHPVRRRVALKLIKPGMDSKQVIARFEQERQALALMDHPHVAKVFDAGVTDPDSGSRPYFAMEYVQGIPITAYCDVHRLSITKRLNLFMQACHAIQHAHQKGIIHRDIKPSNVMVTLTGGEPGDSGGEEPQVKVIDFGVAKAIDRTLTEKTLFTEHGQLLGTPEYMSPEQAEMTGLNIDTRTDIYSLGVLLYELLTGSLPFESTNLRSRAFGEIQRIIREEEPHKPSTRLSSLSHAEASADGAKGTGGSRGTGGTGGSIDEVASRRKTSVHALTRIIRGDLDWIVMMALDKDRTLRYPSANALAEDIHRFLHNEPVMASPPSAIYRAKKFVRRNRALVTGAAAVLVVFVIGAVLVTFFWMAETRAHARSERLFQQGHKLALYFMDDLYKDINELPLTLETKQRMVDEAVKYIKSLEMDVEDDIELKIDLARGYRRIGQMLGGKRGANKGKTLEAMVQFRKSIAAHEEIVAMSQGNRKNKYGLMASHISLADLLDQGDPVSALDHNIMAQQICQDLLSTDESDTLALRYASVVELEIGDYHKHQGDYEEAETWYAKSMEKRRTLLRINPVDIKFRRSLTIGLTRLADLSKKLGKHEKALDYYTECLGAREVMLKEDPESTRKQRDVMLNYHYLASILYQLERKDECLEKQKLAIEKAVHLKAIDDEDNRPREDLVDQLTFYGDILKEYGNLEKSTQQYREALKECQQLALDFPKESKYRDTATTLKNNLQQLESIKPSGSDN